MKFLFALKPSNRKWHLPVMAGICVGVPVLTSWFFDDLAAGKLAALAGLSILYIQSDRLAERMMLLMTCCFGIMLSYGMGLIFSFNKALAPILLGLYAFGVHYSIYKLKLTRPPGNFFFIMLPCVAISSPFNLEQIPIKIGYIAMGTMLTCIVGFVYSLITLKKEKSVEPISFRTSPYTNLVECIIFGFFIGLSIALGFALELENPYWVPVSCMAIMHGVNAKHIWQRGVQRIIGTLVGVGITWAIVLLHPGPLFIAIAIVVLQIIIELLIVRNYTYAVVFITVMTIFLAESSTDLSNHANALFQARLVDIVIGTVVGVIGGFVLYSKKVHEKTTLGIKKAKVVGRKLTKH